jgi:hypothetical protein
MNNEKNSINDEGTAGEIYLDITNEGMSEGISHGYEEERV